MKPSILTIIILLITSCSFAQNVKLTKKEKEQAINSLIQKLNDNYVFPDVAKQAGQSIKKFEKQGVYTKVDNKVELAKLLTNQLRELMHDKHLNLWYNAKENLNLTGKEEEEAIFKQLLKRTNLGFPKIDVLDGNIGYLKINVFGQIDKVRETCAGAMAFLANTDALIIDLRNNQGGEPETVQYLVSYFFGNDPVHINSLYSRKGNKTDEFWTVPVKGTKYLDKPVFILTSESTFSAGEEMSYDLKTQNRATLIGEVTGGAANDGEVEDLGNGFFVFIPNGRAINPITHTNWEGVGVQPDVLVPAAKALVTAHQMALKTVAEKMPGQEKAFYLKAFENIKNQ
ncbi:S41 family peptidase [Pedobacter sp.]|uniref:S41 family peptidase n=1 Tax=Pedobacter sp. TaxID=1411316 RepID=UPI00396C94C0